MARTRTLRLSHTLSPFGPGAIYDFLGESFLVMGNDKWQLDPGRRLARATLLEEKLGKELHLAPIPPADGHYQPLRHGLPVYRFPAWLFCPKCFGMVRWKHREDERGEVPACRRCHRVDLVPMRFVAACQDGHLCDVPWDRWAHSEPTTEEQSACRRDDALEFKSEKEGGGSLASLWVKCRGCGAKRNMEKVPGKSSMAMIGWKCPGKQPWQIDRNACDKPLVVLQRGASNLWFGKVDSAISIPPFSDYDPYGELEVRLRGMSGFSQLQDWINRGMGSLPFVEALAENLAGNAGCSTEQVLESARRDLQPNVAHPVPSDIPGAEWTAFMVPHAGQHYEDEFVTSHQVLDTPLSAGTERLVAGIREKVDKLVIASRLRELRALTGFQRVNFEGDPQPTAPGHPEIKWLPALEVRGEGIFISFREFALAQWEGQRDVTNRALQLEKARAAGPMGRWLPQATARFIMLHTLSHILMRQLVFECGYSSASLRERIYCRSQEEGDPMAGILIYTAAGDTEGTMGGLARQGQAKHLLPSLASALQGASWCSSDPICWESPSQGVGGTNMAACHACGLVPETSCIAGNALLDRRLVVDKEFGFLGQETDTILNLRMDRGSQ